MPTENELTVNDTYLIVDKKNPNSNKNLIISYRKNLLLQLKEISNDFLKFRNDDLDDSQKFRRIVDMADNKGYWIYQLTRL